MSLLHTIALTLIPGLGNITARALILDLGGSENVFNTRKQGLLQTAGVGSKTALAILKHSTFERAETELKFIQQKGIAALTECDSGYPVRLKQCYDAPIVMYFRGTADLNAKRIISVVGTRNATGYGRELIQALTESLREKDVLVVSGLAYGIDVLAHRACLKSGVPTVGVLGHGLDRLYPAQHKQTALRMLENGGLLSEFISGTNPDRENFPKRNRIIAGISDATIVLEAGHKGGALITAELANSYNRDVFAFPGNVNSEFSEGCNRLIRNNKAHLVTCYSDIEYLLGWNVDQMPKAPVQTSLMLNFSAEERQVVDLLCQHTHLGIDEMAQKCTFLQSKLAATLLALEMQGIVTVMPGKTYKIS